MSRPSAEKLISFSLSTAIDFLFITLLSTFIAHIMTEIFHITFQTASESHVDIYCISLYIFTLQQAIEMPNILQYLAECDVRAAYFRLLLF